MSDRCKTKWCVTETKPEPRLASVRRWTCSLCSLLQLEGLEECIRNASEKSSVKVDDHSEPTSLPGLL